MPTIRFHVESLEGERLDRSVAAHAARAGVELSNRKAKQLVEDGRVRVDGREAWKASRNLKQGQRVEAKIPDSWVTESPPELLELDEEVLFHDDFVIAVNKPPGLPTHATHDPDRDHLRAAVERWLVDRGVAEPYVAIHHRLDVDTSGVLIFGIDRRANKGLAEAFAERLATKEYLALVAGTARPDFEVTNHLSYDRRKSRMETVHSGGDFAHTGFEVVAEVEEYALIRAHLHTGRRHQIRVHLAGEGVPIVGDALYGGAITAGGVSVERAMLHAERLELPHPVTGEPLKLAAPLPADFRAVADHLGLSEGD